MSTPPFPKMFLKVGAIFTLNNCQMREPFGATPSMTNHA